MAPITSIPPTMSTTVTADDLAAEYGPRDLKGYGQHTPGPKWPNGAKIAISIVLNYEEGSEVTGGEDGVTEMSGSEVGQGMVPMRGGARDVNTERCDDIFHRSCITCLYRSG